ncbi:MAG: N-acetylmuramic acid 6-phosphate etherase, partial [Acidobacteriaceae bacterium]
MDNEQNTPGPRVELSGLSTEARNERAAGLDTKSALEIAAIINAEDQTVAEAVGRAIPQIARVIDAAAAAMGGGGRLIYVGAGTSGRLGALDASECPPTFGVSYETVQYVMAGGPQALAAAAEANEDSRELGERDMAARNPGPKDLVVGIAA